MRRFTWIVTVALLVCAGGASSAQAQSNWDVVLNGRAIHVNAERHWNEQNWGLGIERQFDSSGPWVKVALANGFKDSVGHPSYMAGGGLKRRFTFLSDELYFDVGVIGFLMTREDVHHNQPFPGALPAVTIGTKNIALNVTYLPEVVVDRVTKANLQDPAMKGVFFLQLKLNANLFGLRRPRGRLLFANSEDD